MRITWPLQRAAFVGANRIATIDGDERRTWKQVVENVARIAAVLARTGVGSGDRVAIIAHNSAVYFDCYFAVPWCGGVLMPLNTRLAVPEIAFQLRDAGAEVLLYGREFEGVAAALHAEGAVGAVIAMDGEDVGSLRYETAGVSAMSAAPAEDGALAGIFYTGGTTGLPKGVMLSHANLTCIASNLLMHIPYDETCVNFHAAPMFHLADIGILMATMAAGTHVFRRAFDAESILADVSRHGVTHCFTVPAMIDRMTASPAREGLDLSSLRVIGYGGSSMPAASFARARAAFPDVDFIQGFGQTEMAAATFLSPRDHKAGADPDRLRSAGQPCIGYDLRIVDEAGVEAPRGVVGEIVGRGGNVMMGYWNRPDETAAVMRNGWLHTGDTGYMDDEGYVFIVDRLKDMIVSGAENVYSIEVENAMSWHPAVAEAAVIGVADEKWGERVHAVVVLKAGVETLTLEDLVVFCRTRIAGYKCPKSMELRETPLPRSAAGKVLKTALRAERQARAET